MTPDRSVDRALYFDQPLILPLAPPNASSCALPCPSKFERQRRQPQPMQPIRLVAGLSPAAVEDVAMLERGDSSRR